MKDLAGKPSVFPHFRGAFCDYFYVHPTMAVFRLPDTIDDAVAASINCALSQMMLAFERADVRLGDRIVIQGAGGRGLYATAIANESGAGQIVVIYEIEQRLSLARELGATDTVRLSDFDSASARAKHVRTLTGVVQTTYLNSWAIPQ